MAWYDFIFDWVLEKLRPLWDWVNDIWEKLYDLYYKARDYAYDKYLAAKSYARSLIEDVENYAYGLFDDVKDYAYRKYLAAKAYAEELVSDLSVAIPAWIVDAVNSVKTWWSDTTTYVTNAIQGVKDWFGEQWIVISTWFEEAKVKISELPAFIENKINEFWNSVKDTIEAVIPQNIIDAVNDITYFMFHPLEKVEEGVISIIESFVPREEEVNEKFKEEWPLPV